MRVFRKVIALNSHDAKALAGWGFHHPPSFNLLYALSTQRLEPLHFGFDVIRFDIQMHTAFVRHLLNLDVQAVGSCVQFALLRACTWTLHWMTERLTPKRRSTFQVVGFTVDDEAG